MSARLMHGIAPAEKDTDNAAALNEKGRAEFVMANTTTRVYSCSMKITEGVRKYAAEQGIAEEDALKKGMEAKSKEFVEKRAEGFAKA